MRPTLVRVLLVVLALCVGVCPALANHKIGVLLKGRTKFWSVVEQGARDAGEKFGVEIIVKAPPTESDVAAQILLLNALGAQGVEAIVLAAGNKDTLAAPAAALAARGIRIITIDSPLAGEAGHVFVGTSHRAAGEAAGLLLAGLVGDADQLSLFRHAQNNAATDDREEGAVAALRKAHPGIVVFSDVFAGNEPDLQAERARLLLSRHPGTKAVLASGTPGTMVMLKELAKREPPGGIKFVGFGFNLNEEVAAALEAGVMHGWIAQQPREIGLRGIEAAVNLLEGKPVPPVVNIDVIVVTKANLHDPSTQALLKL
jgi:ribose transport system substrate-binding protein